MNAVVSMPVAPVSIASSAVLIRLKVGVWTARKRDKEVSDEVDADKGTRVRAGNYNKHILPDTKELDAIQTHASATRNWLNTVTTPWDDAGDRLLPTALAMAVTDELNTRTEQFYALVDELIRVYDLKIQAAQFNLGALFKADDYPSADVIRSKFYMEREFKPVPQSGHFCVDIGVEGNEMMRKEFQEASDKYIANALRSNWDRLFNTLTVLSRQLGSYNKGDGRRAGGIHESVLDNALELCAVLKSLNITNDPALEKMRKDLQMTLQGVEVKELRKDAAVRDGVKAEIDSLLSKFDF